MKRVRAGDLVPGMATAAEVTNGDGLVKLLEDGARLTPAHIAAICNWGVPLVAVDDAAAGEARLGGVHRTEAEFLEIYTGTVNAVVDAFSNFEKEQEVPVIRLRELAEQRVCLLTETVGAIEFLHRIRHHSERTLRHSLNVAIIAGILGKWLGCQAAKQQTLILAGLLHDVGKLNVPLSILEKPGPLSPEEYAAIKRHSQEGYRLVGHSGQVAGEVGLSILQHHERLDGSGYPNGLAGDAICTEAAVIAVADTYDAMTSDRAYRRRVTPFAALEEISEEMFHKLDPAVSTVFLDNMLDRLIGWEVTLSDGQTAKVIGFGAGDRYSAKPVVCTEKGELIDLKQREISIKGVG